MYKLLATITLSFSLYACGTSVKLDDDSSKRDNHLGSSQQQYNTGNAQIDETDVNSLKTAINARFTIYFDFDNFSVKPEFQTDLSKHAKFLQRNPSYKVTLEGHTDERGGHEYNLALGQKRAAAVLKTIAFFGAKEQQLEAISFGKEKPVAIEHDEAAFSRNRRVEIIYLK